MHHACEANGRGRVDQEGQTGSRRPPYDSAETREMLMNTAEEIFADLGVEGVSIRSINAAPRFGGIVPTRRLTGGDKRYESV
jgi:hypothetical protein